MEGEEDERVGQILELIVRLAGGDVAARGVLSERNDSMDGILAGLNVLAQELEARQQAMEAAEEELRRRNADLARTNAELEEFAWIASHDLKEPLRMVASFTSLLERRYADQLDPTAQQWISFAVEGATRMHALLDDLLRWTRVGREGSIQWVDCQQLLVEVSDVLRIALEERNAVLEVGRLPRVLAIRSDLMRLFTNLIGNGLKFCEAAPRIQVFAQERGDHWYFGVRDNGIGIEPQYRDRIFQVFQRLHRRGTYEGTGIGLAICKKIVEHHGGAIGVESEPGSGALFWFTLPRPEEPRSG